MPSIISFSLKKEDVEAITKELVVGKNATYIPLSMFINDENDKFGQNVSITVNQSKEDREAKIPKTYIGNGKVVWTSNGSIKTAKSLGEDAPNSDW